MTGCLRGIGGAVRYIKRRVLLFFVNAIAVHPEFAPIQKIRIFTLRFLGVSVGEDCQFSESLYILYGHNLAFGAGCRLGTHARIYDFSPIKISKNLLASHGITLISGTHHTDTYDPIPGPITIGQNVWIGINVTIVGPVIIGDNAVIGANSLVIRDIPDNAIVAGVPAKILRLKTIPQN